MAAQEDASSRKKQRFDYGQARSNNHDEMDAEDMQPPLNTPVQAVNSATKGGPVSGPKWSCRGCGRCNIHHTTTVPGCWACMQILLNGCTFDADRWGDFTICQQMKAARLSQEK